MDILESTASENIAPPFENLHKDPLSQRLRNSPWWFLAIILIAIWTVYSIYTRDNFREAFVFIRIGLRVTVVTTITAYMISLILGLITGLWRISNNIVLKNIATFYVEVIRGIPMLVLIFYIALVGVPGTVVALNQLGQWMESQGLQFLAVPFTALDNQNISMNVRAIIALAVTYGAFQAEIFRAGIQSITRGQMEAARSLGMTYGQAMTHIILPQAIRNVLPALGNDFIAMVKDSSLVSLLAVRDISQVARLYAGRSFRFNEAYTTLAVMYLTMTVILSLFVKLIEKWLRKDQ
jgi:polar amino acid transport system permease protein